MTDLVDLLERAAGDLPVYPFDVEGDIGRGRQALRRRRAGAAGGLLALGVAASMLPRIVGLGGSSDVHELPAGGTSTGSMRSTGQPLTCDDGTVRFTPGGEITTWTCTDPPSTEVPGPTAAGSTGALTLLTIQGDPTGRTPLVPSTVARAGGYALGLVPRGWTVQGATAYGLTLAPARDGNTDPNDLTGKLAIGLEPSSTQVLPTRGEMYSEGDLLLEEPLDRVLGARFGHGQLLVQFPSSLGWTADDVERFARSFTLS